MIRLENVCKNFGDLQVLKNVNLEVKEGEKLVIIGPSGSGKSTTVRCMNFLEEPTSGHVYIDGQKLTHANKTKIIRESISMVFQQFNLYPHMTVLKNLTIAPMKLHHKSIGSGGSGISLSRCSRSAGQGTCISHHTVRRTAAEDSHSESPVCTDEDHTIR